MGIVTAWVGAVLALAAADVVPPEWITPAGWVREGLQELAWLDGFGGLAATGLLSAAGLGGFVLTCAELAPLVRRPYMRGEHGTDREFAVQEKAVEQMVQFAGEQIEYVVAVQDANVTRDEQGLEEPVRWCLSRMRRQLR